MVQHNYQHSLEKKVELFNFSCSISLTIPGQFKDLRVKVHEHKSGHHHQSNKPTGTMTFLQSSNRKSVPVHQGQRLNMVTKEHTKCWFVRNNGRGLLDGKVQNYRVKNILFNKLAPGLKKKLTI